MHTFTYSLHKSIGGLLLALAAVCSCAHAKVPSFVNESIYSSNRATVSTIESSLAADIVILTGGLEQGLRLGMVCSVERGSESIGELIVIESKSNYSAALILNLIDRFSLRAGDSVRIKTLQNS